MKNQMGQRSRKLYASCQGNHGIDFKLKNGRIHLLIKTRIWDEEHVEVHDVTDKLKPIFDKLEFPLKVNSVRGEDIHGVLFDEFL